MMVFLPALILTFSPKEKGSRHALRVFREVLYGVGHGCSDDGVQRKLRFAASRMGALHEVWWFENVVFYEDAWKLAGFAFNR